MKVIREGFWHSDREPHLPRPVAQPEPWAGQAEFLRQLEIVEQRAKVDSARGTSRCRVCGAWNGSREFSMPGAVWPDGFRHYVEARNVEPSEEFRRFVREESEREQGKAQR